MSTRHIPVLLATSMAILGVPAISSGASKPEEAQSRLASALARAEAAATDSARDLLLDRRASQQLYESLQKAFVSSTLFDEWNDEHDESSAPPVVSISPMANETGRPIGSALDAILGKFETYLVNDTPMDVLSPQAQPALRRELRLQRSDEAHPSEAPDPGERSGADYRVTGRAEELASSRGTSPSVTYRVTLQIVDLDRRKVVFEASSDISRSRGG